MPLQQGVLHVLGDQAGEEPGAVRPLFHPPAPVRDGLLDEGDHVRLGDLARGQIGEHEGARRVQGLFQGADRVRSGGAGFAVGVHVPIVRTLDRTTGTKISFTP